MSDHHRYKRRDFDFARLLVTLRRRANLTQEDVALHLRISEKAIRNWEGGSNYPSEVNLRKLIELYLQKNVFAPGHEQDEACLLWEQLHERTPHLMSSGLRLCFKSGKPAVMHVPWHLFVLWRLNAQEGGVRCLMYLCCMDGRGSLLNWSAGC